MRQDQKGTQKGTVSFTRQSPPPILSTQERPRQGTPSRPAIVLSRVPLQRPRRSLLSFSNFLIIHQIGRQAGVKEDSGLRLLSGGVLLPESDKSSGDSHNQAETVAPHSTAVGAVSHASQNKLQGTGEGAILFGGVQRELRERVRAGRTGQGEEEEVEAAARTVETKTEEKDA